MICILIATVVSLDNVVGVYQQKIRRSEDMM